MEAKHTPGPWRIEGSRGAAGIIISAGVNAERDGPKSYVGVFDPMFRAPEVNHAANARLIAAAPDLLEALKSARGALDVAIRANVDLEGFDPSETMILKLIDAAIAKAEGRS